jgi:hypothetical protein
MHHVWNIPEVRSSIFAQISPLHDLAQLAVTCRTFTEPAVLELLTKQTSITRLKGLIPSDTAALLQVSVLYFFNCILLLYAIRIAQTGLTSPKLWVL